MINKTLIIIEKEDRVTLSFQGELTLYTIEKNQKKIDTLNLKKIRYIEINLLNISYLDTATAIFFNNIEKKFREKKIKTTFISQNRDVLKTLKLVVRDNKNLNFMKKENKVNFFYRIGDISHQHLIGFLLFMTFLGNLFITKIHYLKSIKDIRFKE
ncbi:MAG: STAS domain-containing protein, partial [Campylobacterota bacterium]|nr:STAS domain-containing protein [Campylobacterota bacterium]